MARICYVVATSDGAAWVAEQLSALRDRHGFDVCAVLSGRQGSLADRLREASIPVHVMDFGFATFVDLVTLPAKVLALARLFRRERFDVVQTHLFHSMVIGRVAAWIADVPVRL